MSKTIKIIIAVILVAAAGFFLYKQFANRSTDSDDFEAMKKSLLAPADVKATDLTEEIKQKYLERLEKAQKSAVEFNFDNLTVINDIGFIKQSLGDIEGAITAWEYANIIRPKNSLSFFNLANLYFYKTKDLKKAEKNYLIALENDRKDMNIVRNLYELYYLELKDNAKTEALLLSSLADNPDSADLTALLAGFYAENGQIERAIEFYEQHLKIRPNNEAARQELERLKKEAAK